MRRYWDMTKLLISDITWKKSRMSNETAEESAEGPQGPWWKRNKLMLSIGVGIVLLSAIVIGATLGTKDKWSRESGGSASLANDPNVVGPVSDNRPMTSSPNLPSTSPSQSQAPSTPTSSPSSAPSFSPTFAPTTLSPTTNRTLAPSRTWQPSLRPTSAPSSHPPSQAPTVSPTGLPTSLPTKLNIPKSGFYLMGGEQIIFSSLVVLTYCS